MSPIQQMLLGAGGAIDTKTYVDDVFSTHLFKGNAGTQAINNGINLAGEGGLVWTKNRESAFNNFLYDTERGVQKYLISDSNIDQQDVSTSLTAFNSNGFTLGANDYGNITNGNKATSWSFRKAKGWFDIQEYNGNNGNVFNLSHDLECKPCFIIIKQLNTAENWIVWIKGLGSGKNLRLNLHNDQSSDSGTDIGHTVTSSYIRIPNGSAVNGNSSNSKYICYLWGDGAESEGQIFGESGDKSLILTGTYSSNQNEQTINLGWEPSWILIKKTNGNRSWFLFDTMRGIVSGDKDEALYPNSNSARNDEGNLDHIDVTPTGFIIKSSSYNNQINDSGGEYVYVAIRAATGSVTRPPSLGTDVFGLGMSNASSTTPCHVTNFITDFAFVKTPASTNSWYTGARLMGLHHLLTDTTAAEANNTDYTWDSNTGFAKVNGTNWQHWAWKRHAGFDLCAYHLTEGGGTHTQNHSLGKVPEMIIMKDRDNTDGWIVYHKGLNGGTNPKDYFIQLQGNGTESNFSNLWGTSASDINATSFYINQNYRYTGNHIALLFASVDGISKVGYYTGNGVKTGNVQTLGFQPRFILIKCADTASTPWMVFDTLLGINSGNDNFLQLNSDTSTSAGDYIDLTSDGFDVVEDHNQVNGNNKKYLFYAHA